LHMFHVLNEVMRCSGGYEVGVRDVQADPGIFCDHLVEPDLHMSWS
jgi:hypothetical protein